MTIPLTRAETRKALDAAVDVFRQWHEGFIPLYPEDIDALREAIASFDALHQSY